MDWMTAQEAAEALGITLPTLYAYVSRGMIRSEPGEGTRKRRYKREDVEALARRRDGHRDPERAVRESLDFGVPVLDSAISLIEGGRLYYRGHDATELARERSVEDVAALLWGRPLPAATPDAEALDLAVRSGLPPVEAMQVALPVAASRDLSAWDPRPDALVAVGARILALFVGVAGGSPGPIAASLAAAWGRPEAEPLIAAALILCADHELNVSAFTARCVASAGATPYHAVNAGLSALQGTRHGGYTSRVEALFAEVESVGSARDVVVARIKRGEEIPGFGHRLYPAGDPRGQALLAWGAPPCPPVHDVVHEALGLHPTVDYGLVYARRAARLPPHAALTMFAIGRTIGWIGHVLEQAPLPMIRPRARYVGPRP
jgi:citrate synthase